MDERTAFRALFAYLRRTAGGSLRTVVRYDRESYQVLYGADALSTYTDDEMGAFVDDFREEHAADRRRERMYDVGSLESTVRLFDDTVVLHLLGADDVGVVVSLYPEAASDLSSFVAGCHERLSDCPAFAGPDAADSPASNGPADAVDPGPGGPG
ncbi:DUF7522 family protein [Candidatus Halobonum tyrrellensis]|uniref:Uncharacterized protein n=1 Tax=Candidatus Halobonum tyrrellensis G22 TaxID=1324957 RepID=V4IXV4_9EURY|nr:hypothetical protein [Candidatus Halobonum tyrrellensis]ESP87992.1 hypothetical protein K933_11776 [Candidatus Halobonum tyrrellensis G22]